jgi:hypothetical protein
MFEKPEDRTILDFKIWLFRVYCERKSTTEAQVVRKNPFMLREPQHERGGVIDNSSV